MCAENAKNKTGELPAISSRPCGRRDIGIQTLTSVGVVEYSPKLLGDRRSDKWWLILRCDPSLGEYYRHLYSLACFRTQKLLRPAWVEHITVVRNEPPPNMVAWERHLGKCETFCYNPVPQTNGAYWWLAVECPSLLDLREELGLSREPLIPLHLSFGHEVNHEGS